MKIEFSGIYEVPKDLEDLFGARKETIVSIILNEHLEEALENSPDVTGKVTLFDGELKEEWKWHQLK